MTIKSNVSRPSRSLEFGFNYLPSIGLVEDFSPYWVENKWTPEQMAIDLRIMRSLGARWVRFHIMPIVYERDGYSGIRPEEYSPLIHAGIQQARAAGLNIHLDLHSDVFYQLEIGEVLERVAEFGPEVDVVQIINEYFPLWDNPRNLSKMEAIFTAIRRNGYAGKLCFDANASQFEAISRNYPNLYKELSLIPIHFYPESDEWNETAVAEIMDKLKAYRGDGKPLVVTECNISGGLKGGSFAGASSKIEQWPRLIERIAGETGIQAVFHHCFRNKMSWREYGHSQCGVVLCCSIPKLEADIYRETAFRYLPDDDPMRHIRLCFSEPSAVNDRSDSVGISVENIGAMPVSGQCALAINHAACSQPGPVLSLDPGQAVTITAPLDDRDQALLHKGVNALFASWAPVDCSTPCIAWKKHPALAWTSLVIPSAISITKALEPLPRVRYASSMENIESFFGEYGRTMSLHVTNIAWFDTELAFRLQNIVAARTGTVPAIRALVQGIAGYKDRAAILIAQSRTNYFAQLIEEKLAPEYRTASGDHGIVTVVEQPFKDQLMRVGRWNPDKILYFGGADDDALKAAVYDFIHRVWNPAFPVSAQDYSEAVRWEDTRKHRLSLEIAPGRYRLVIHLGRNTPTTTHETIIELPDTGHKWAIDHAQDALTVVTEITAPTELLTMTIAPGKRSFSISTLELHDIEYGVSDRRWYFGDRQNLNLDFQGYIWIQR